LEKRDKAHIVKLENNKLVCDCLESCFEGIPCRHELCVYIKGTKPVNLLNFQKRWTKEYFDVTSVPEIVKKKKNKSEAVQEESNVSEILSKKTVVFFLHF